MCGGGGQEKEKDTPSSVNELKKKKPKQNAKPSQTFPPDISAPSEPELTPPSSGCFPAAAAAAAASPGKLSVKALKLKLANVADPSFRGLVINR